MRNESDATRIRPFLTQAATPVDPGVTPLPGTFDSRRDVWVIGEGAQARPIIQTRNDLGDTETGTKVQAETDDSDVGMAGLGETVTTTRVQSEVDDSDITAATLEIVTKTYAQIESEDHHTEIVAAEDDECGFSGLALPIQ